MERPVEVVVERRMACEVVVEVQVDIQHQQPWVVVVAEVCEALRRMVIVLDSRCWQVVEEQVREPVLLGTIGLVTEHSFEPVLQVTVLPVNHVVLLCRPF